MGRRANFELPSKPRIWSSDYKPAPKVYGNTMVIQFGTKEAVQALFGQIPDFEVVEIGAASLRLRRKSA